MFKTSIIENLSAKLYLSTYSEEFGLQNSQLLSFLLC